MRILHNENAVKYLPFFDAALRCTIESCSRWRPKI